jgi:hypothetical protein
LGAKSGKNEFFKPKHYEISDSVRGNITGIRDDEFESSEIPTIIADSPSTISSIGKYTILLLWKALQENQYFGYMA